MWWETSTRLPHTDEEVARFDPQEAEEYAGWLGVELRVAKRSAEEAKQAEARADAELRALRAKREGAEARARELTRQIKVLDGAQLAMAAGKAAEEGGA